MSSSDPYNVGTASVANGATTVTGVGTIWVGRVKKNDLFTDPAQGLFARVTADATSNTSLTINPWPGSDMSGDAYEIIPGDSTENALRVRELLAQLSVIEANGRGLFYLFSNTTADADPGAGNLRLNNADASLATALYIDNLDANGATATGELDAWDDSTSVTKGRLWLRSISDPSSFRVYRVTGSILDGTGYRKATLVHVGGSGSFANADQIMVFFVPAGDTGDGYVTDATVADTSELTALEGEDPGYRVFVTDLGTDFGAYTGLSGVVELVAGPDWELVARYTGPVGPAPNLTIGTVTTLDAGDPADATVTGTNPNYALNLEIPQGAKGIVWVDDAWDSGTTYAKDEGTQREGSSWRSLQDDNLNHAPPSLPTTSNAWWALVARRGIDGAGTVNSVVAGTGISVDNTDPTAPEVSIAGSGVTNANMANMAQATIKGRAAGAGTGAPSDLSGSQAMAILMAGGQIPFPATQNPSSDPNTLDDYEEGITIPAVSATSGTISNAAAEVRYRKIGKRVHFDAYIHIIANGTGAGRVTIPLPFTNSGLLAVFASMNGIAAPLVAFSLAGASTIQFLTAAGAYPGGSGAELYASGSFDAAS